MLRRLRVWLSLAALCLCTLGLPKPAVAESAAPQLGWDLTAEGGPGFELYRSARTYLGRLSAGLLYGSSRWALGLSPTASVAGLSSWAAGGQLSLLWSRPRLSLLLGTAYNGRERLQTELTVAWSVIAAEWQHDSRGDALYVKLRAPIGAIFFFDEF